MTVLILFQDNGTQSEEVCGFVSDTSFSLHLAGLVASRLMVREYHTRMQLLRHFDGYAYLLRPWLLEHILPEVSLE
ncbi:unnamed protein product [Protopolystoma xenopodis]|uniref:Uncharacterized protein n=1 Tax=Protopolystoma xenopodis TaxID=117903 RepID=A0A3S4ZT76_9PLAT|nr:unnamed protein product [Protopolystoma xenopodis]